MTCYPVKTENRIFVKANGFLSFIKNMSKNIGKNISKNVSTIYSQKRFDHARRSGTDTLKILPKEWLKNTAEATGDLIGNKIADKITSVSRKKSAK